MFRPFGQLRGRSGINAGSMRSGISMVLVVIMLVMLVGFVSLAVDIGRVRLARAELQTAADAGARSGAWSLPVSQGAVETGASDAANDNEVIDDDQADKKHL